MTAEFRVLGTLEVTARGRVVPLPPGHSRVVLAGLLLHANEVVPVDRLVQWLWNDAPPNPERVGRTIHMIMTRLRRALGEANVVATAPGGYVARVRRDQLDLLRFRDLVASGAHAEALSLWPGPGPVLTDVVSDSLHRDVIAPLLQERLAALELRIEDDLVTGVDVLPELRSLTRLHPLREKFWTHLILALHRAGRQSDALAAYRAVTRLLAEAMGSTPGQELRDLHQRILTGAEPKPHELPAVTPHFVARDAELGLLDDATSLVVISGTAGVGKTTLALRWAHAVADRFPDGRLYVDLRGFDPGGEPVRPADALRGFLDALRCPQISSTAEGRAAQLRSLLAGRKMLVLLDNARDAEQVRPLLPASPGCLAVVTSRNPLSGLVAREGARPLTLPALTREEASALLESHLGTSRIRAEPDAAVELADRCAGLPLALSVVAARATLNPTFSLRALAGALTDEATRLDMLADEDPAVNVRAVFSWSYLRLKPDAARLFRLFSLHPGQDAGVHAIACLAGVPVASARRLLDELKSAQMVMEHAPDRFSCHDLLRVYARELTERHDPASSRRAAVQRVLDFYLHCADIADSQLPVTRSPIEITVEHPPAEIPALDDAWFDTEAENLLAAAELGHTWQFAYTLSRYLWLRADWPTWLRLCHQALPSAADRLDARLAMLFNISSAHHQLHDYDEALRWGAEALSVSALVSEAARGRVLAAMAHALEEMERYEEAEQRYLEAAAVDDPWVAANASHHLGIVHRKTGRWDEAERELTAALPRYERIGEKVGMVACHADLAALRLDRGHLVRALAGARTALELARECNSPYYEAIALELIGDATSAAKPAEPALELIGDAGETPFEHWEKALAIYEELGVAEADRVREKLAQAVRNV
ncbi:tetratricopeptide repeat protein [Lentzea alba]|uniref:AfsR/SARP family transcriptional regulator n=1 Tax=Lentzea alba TaxID=2714351 RepID=UPI0039BEFEA9